MARRYNPTQKRARAGTDIGGQWIGPKSIARVLVKFLRDDKPPKPSPALARMSAHSRRLREAGPHYQTRSERTLAGLRPGRERATLERFLTGEGPAQPLAGVSRSRLDRTARDMRLPRGASAQDVLAAVRQRNRAAKQAGPPRGRRFTLTLDGRRTDVGVYVGAGSGQIMLYEESDRRVRGRHVVTVEDLDELQRWAGHGGHRELASWAEREQAMSRRRHAMPATDTPTATTDAGVPAAQAKPAAPSHGRGGSGGVQAANANTRAVDVDDPAVGRDPFGREIRRSERLGNLQAQRGELQQRLDAYATRGEPGRGRHERRQIAELDAQIARLRGQAPARTPGAAERISPSKAVKKAGRAKAVPKAAAFNPRDVADRVTAQSSEAAIIKLLAGDEALTSAKLRGVAGELGVDIPDNVKSKGGLQLHIAEKVARERGLPGGFGATPASKAVKKAARVRAPAEDPADAAARLSAATTREQAREALRGKTVAELKAVAKTTGTALAGASTKDAIAGRIVEHTVGFRLNSQTIREGSWQRVSPSKAVRKAATAARKTAEPADAVAAQLSTVGTRAEAQTLLSGETVARLREIAKRAGIRLPSGARKAELVDGLVEGTVGNRLNSQAIRLGAQRGAVRALSASPSMRRITATLTRRQTTDAGDPVAGVDLQAMDEDSLVDLFLRLSSRDRPVNSPAYLQAFERIDAELRRHEAARTGLPVAAPDHVDADTPERRRIDELLARGVDFREAYADAYNLDPAQLERQELASRVDAERRPGETRERAVRRLYDEVTHLLYLQAEEWTRGNLLNREGAAENARRARRGEASLDPVSLFSGSRIVARKYASEELKRFWAEVAPRQTYTEFRAVMLAYRGDRQRAETIRLGGSGRDFGL